MNIDYDHGANPHTLGGPSAAWPKLFSHGIPASILDVGCGIGTWLKVAINSGVTDVFGIDGVEIPPEQLLFPPDKFLCRDLTKPVDLRRRFDVVICLEVAEHLEAHSSNVLIKTLTKHSDAVIFSAGCIGQPGQHHVNCQWPDYWQRHFNSVGFICEDTLRCKLWDDPHIEYWYKQNMFIARRDSQAGKEPRIKAILHPEMQALMAKPLPTFDEYVDQIEKGRMPTGWYFKEAAHRTIPKIDKKASLMPDPFKQI